VVLNTELRTPRLLLGNLLHGTGSSAGDYAQALVFADYGRLFYVDKQPDETEYELFSVGLGLRYTMSTHLSLRADYGLALKNRDLNRRDNGRLHFGLMASF
jgi:hemolysin activation/secretion protein